ncbi:hypothetical protein PCK1_000853 [Pneumocystis canis]|nr:hypothetical protein PCK1_000853 [Pneumocystis canis]
MNLCLIIILINITYIISKDNVLGFINTNFNSFNLHNRDAFKIRSLSIKSTASQYGDSTDEILIRTLVDVLKGSIYQEACIAFLEEKCLKLAKMSKELAEKCINAEETCNSLIKIVEKKCETLKTEIKVALENKNNVNLFT